MKRRLLIGVALLLAAACGRCGDDDVAPEPETEAAPAEVRVSSRVDVDPSSLVVHHADQLAALDLSPVVELDLAMSEADRIGHLDEGDPQTACAIDLPDLARRTPNLRALRVSGCAAAVDAGLHAFADRLVALELADLPLQGATIAELATLSGLQTLTLTRVTAQSKNVHPLASIPLRTLVLAELETDSDLSLMLDLWPRTLQEVALQGRWAGHKAMLTLNRAEALRRLELSGTRITNFSFHQIKELPKLSELILSGDTFTDASPLYFRQMPLQRLSCDCPRLSDAGLRALGRSEHLTRLDLPRSAVTGPGLSALTDLPKLRHLVLEGRPMDGAAISALASLVRLEHLELSGTLQDPTMSGLGDLASLATLRLDFPELDDRVAPELARLAELEALRLGGTRISDHGLEALAGLHRLRVLELGGTRVTNRGLEHLSRLTDLEVLALDHTDVVDEGIAHLAGLGKLQELRLSHTLITDQGLEHLMGMHELRRLDLSHTVVTAEGAHSLERLPNLMVLGLEGTRALAAPEP